MFSDPVGSASMEGWNDNPTLTWPSAPHLRAEHSFTDNLALACPETQQNSGKEEKHRWRLGLKNRNSLAAHAEKGGAPSQGGAAENTLSWAAGAPCRCIWELGFREFLMSALCPPDHILLHRAQGTFLQNQMSPCFGKGASCLPELSWEDMWCCCELSRFQPALETRESQVG